MVVAVLFARAFLGWQFVLASVPKLRAPGAFERAVMNYELLPARASRFVARVLPIAESCVGIALLAGLASPVAATLAAICLVVFAFAVAANLVRGRTPDCGCHGTLVPRTITWSLVVIDLLYAAGAVFVALAPSTGVIVDPARILPAIDVSGADLVASYTSALAIALAGIGMGDAIRMLGVTKRLEVLQ